MAEREEGSLDNTQKLGKIPQFPIWANRWVKRLLVKMEATKMKMFLRRQSGLNLDFM